MEIQKEQLKGLDTFFQHFIENAPQPSVYKHIPNNAVVNNVLKLLQDNRDSLSFSDPNNLTNEIMVKAARINKPPASLFEKNLLDLHASLRQYSKVQELDAIVEGLREHLKTDLEKISKM